MTKEKHDLEAAVRDKVAPLVEGTIERTLGIAIPQLEVDITDKLARPSLHIYIPLDVSFAAAKKCFKKEFLRRELEFHGGNISQLAKTLEIDRRSIHRSVKELGILVDRSSLLGESRQEWQEEQVDRTIRSTLDQYKDIFQPDKMDVMYQQFQSLSKHIAQVLPYHVFRWKEAEEEFERQFLSEMLREQGWDVSSTARKLRLRQETLYRKIKRLELRKK